MVPASHSHCVILWLDGEEVARCKLCHCTQSALQICRTDEALSEDEIKELVMKYAAEERSVEDNKGKEEVDPNLQTRCPPL